MNVPLTFIPPTADDIATLHIWEGATSAGPFFEIDSTPVGTFPDYIREFVTTHANSISDWFAIQWEDAAGVRGNLSASMMGGTTSLIGELIERVLLKNGDLNETIALQEAEAVISYIYGVDDPYTIDIGTVNKLWLSELSNLVYVSCMYDEVIQIGALSQTSYTAGIISESSGGSNNKTVLDNLERLEKRALKRLGIGGSRIAGILWHNRRIIEITEERVGIDSSRLLSLKAEITNRILLQDIPTGAIISDN